MLRGLSGLVCPLCAQANPEHYYQDIRRSYWQCHRCLLVFVAPSDYLSPSQERAEYDLHQNQPDDLGYRNFLARLFTPLNARLPQGARGLDFGCGPGPTLSLMFEETGHSMQLYDHFYYPSPDVLLNRYAFITATEVVEHLHQPMAIFHQLRDCLEPIGTLGLMTKLVKSREAFSRWHYKNDPTHVCFFSRDTFVWLAEQLAMELEILGQDVIILSTQKWDRVSDD